MDSEQEPKDRQTPPGPTLSTRTREPSVLAAGAVPDILGCRRAGSLALMCSDASTSAGADGARAGHSDVSLDPF